MGFYRISFVAAALEKLKKPTPPRQNIRKRPLDGHEYAMQDCPEPTSPVRTWIREQGPKVQDALLVLGIGVAIVLVSGTGAGVVIHYLGLR